MTNIISFEELIGVQPTVHRFEINGRTVLYTSAPIAAKLAIASFQRENPDDKFTLKNICPYASKIFKAQRFEDGDETTDEWIESVAFGDFMHFQQFMSNPVAPGERPDNALPLTLKGFRGQDVVLPPVTLGDYKAFGAFLDGEPRTNDDYLLEQVGAAFDNATLADGSPLPDNFLHGLTEEEGSALINFWMNRQKEEAGNDEGTPEPGEKPKPATGAKSRASSSTSTTSRRSRRTPTTSGT